MHGFLLVCYGKYSSTILYHFRDINVEEYRNFKIQIMSAPNLCTVCTTIKSTDP